MPKPKSSSKHRAPATRPPLPKVGPWNFHERADRSKGVITEWIDESNWSAKTRANFDRSIEQLRPLNKHHWHKPNPASKIGDHTYVIRFKTVTSEQLRVFGHFFDDHHAFVMSMNGHEKDDVYHPKNYENLAESYRTQCADIHRTTLQFEDLCAAC